jgi:putative NADH-flavin reductase
MNITVFGAGGRVGCLVVGELLARHHTVTAVVQSVPRVKLDSVTYVIGDVRNATDVERALQGSEAVISTLGSWGTPTKDILSSGMKVIVVSYR